MSTSYTKANDIVPELLATMHQYHKRLVDAEVTVGIAWVNKHELTHLELVKDEDGNLKADDQGRPQLTTRKHDFQIGGFTEVCKRHGEYALERQSLVVEHEHHCRQLQLAFSESED